MKNVILILTAIVMGTFGARAETTKDGLALDRAVRYDNSFIFVENGITFSVYPDGEFDFFIDDRVNFGANVNFGRTQVTFNSGYNYDPFVQYDDYGAVIQVENVPIYYDYYGRVSQIGDVRIRYNNGRVRRIGGLNVYYNNRGFYSHTSGFINIYNRHYVYRPWHAYFARPAVGFCLVYNRPYRRYYEPVRYTYYRPYQYNRRHAYARIGHQYKYKPSRKRESVYRNDRRVSVRDNRSYTRERYDNDRRGKVTNRDSRDSRRSTGISRGSYDQNSRVGTQRRSSDIDRKLSDQNSRVRRSSEVSRSSGISRRSSDQNSRVRKTADAGRSSKVERRSPERRSVAQPQSRSVKPASRKDMIRKRSSAPERNVTRKTETRRSSSDNGRQVKSVTRSERTVSRSPQRSSSPARSTYSKAQRKSSPAKVSSRSSQSRGKMNTRSRSSRAPQQ